MLDLARPGSAIAAERRSFGSEPADVIASARRLRGGPARGRHRRDREALPGLGAAGVNTDFDAQSISVPLDQLRALDEAPFAAFADSGGELIMLGLASYSAFGNLPAALDPAIATGELRARLGFDGVSITDSLDAAAALAYGDRREVALAAAGAGSDLLLYGDWRTAEATRRDLSPRSAPATRAVRLQAIGHPRPRPSRRPSPAADRRGRS